jgi:hypothetical protein
MGYLWDIYGIFMGYLWDIYEIFMGYLWDYIFKGYFAGIIYYLGN